MNNDDDDDDVSKVINLLEDAYAEYESHDPAKILLEADKSHLLALKRMVSGIVPIILAHECGFAGDEELYGALVSLALMSFDLGKQAQL